jgi:hypothetical protein
MEGIYAFDAEFCCFPPKPLLTNKVWISIFNLLAVEEVF